MSLRNRALGRLLVLSAAAGLVVAGIALPVVGGFGLFARSATSSFNDLPADFRAPPPLQQSRLLAADGSTVARFFTQDRILVPLSKMSVSMQHAIVAIEDARFFQHGGVDLKGTLRAAAADVGHGGAVQGGSTLTQQYVKNVLLMQGDTRATKDTLARKLREARYAIALDKRLPKKEILKRYLNIVYFGEGAYGVEAAAQRYFGEHASQLTVVQSALLAGLVQSPSDYDPVQHPAVAKARRNLVLQKMAGQHMIDRARLSTLQHSPLGVHLQPLRFGCESSWATFYCDWIHSQLLADPNLGSSVAAREHRLLTGGLTIRTTLRPHVQMAAGRAVMHVVPVGSRVATAVAVVQPGTGEVVGMAADRPFGSNRHKHETRVNLPTGGASGYQAGSTFKLFTLAAAIQAGVPLSETINAPYQVHLSGFHDCQGRPLSPWSPHNAVTGEGGTYSLVRATWESVNTYFAQLERKVGVCHAWRLATKMGIREVSTGKPVAQVPTFTLGVADTSPLQVAGAYATIAARGRFCQPWGIVQVTDAQGRTLEHNAPSCRRVMSAHVADVVTSVLRGVINGPDPLRTGARASIGRPAAGKTGTTDGFSAAWFSGYTPQLAASVWVGDPRGGSHHPLRDVTVGGHYYSHVYGADLPVDVWRDTMRGALRGVPARNFPGAGASLASDQPVGQHPSGSSGPAHKPPARKPTPHHGHGHGHH